MQVWSGDTHRMVYLGECALAEPSGPWPEYLVVLDRTKIRRSWLERPAPVTTVPSPFVNFRTGIVGHVRADRAGIDTDHVIRVMPGDDPTKLPGWCPHYG